MKNFGNTEDHVDTPASELHQRPIIPKYAVLTVLIAKAAALAGGVDLHPSNRWAAGPLREIFSFYVLVVSVKIILCRPFLPLKMLV